MQESRAVRLQTERGYLWWLMHIQRNYKQFDIQWSDCFTGQPLRTPRLLSGCVSAAPCLFNQETVLQQVCVGSRCPVCKGAVQFAIEDEVLNEIASELATLQSSPAVRFKDAMWAKLDSRPQYKKFKWNVIVEVPSSFSQLNAKVRLPSAKQQQRVLCLTPWEQTKYLLLKDGGVCSTDSDGALRTLSFRHENSLIRKWQVAALDQDILVGFTDGSLYLCQFRYSLLGGQHLLTKILELPKPVTLSLSKLNLLMGYRDRVVQYRGITYDLQEQSVFPFGVADSSKMLLDGQDRPIVIWTQGNCILFRRQGQEFDIQLPEQAVLSNYELCVTRSDEVLLLSHQPTCDSLRVSLNKQSVRPIKERLSRPSSQLSCWEGICRYIDDKGALRELILLQ